jgi:alkylglycerol monooxygenase
METEGVWKHRLSNWGCGALTVAVGLLLAGLAAPLWAKVALVQWSANPVVMFAAALVAIDFLYYWQHRAEHASKWLWAIHSVHHQSTICDASVSLRTSALAPLTVLVSHLPLAVLGLEFEIYVAAYLVHTAAVFLLHTRTPSWLNRAGRIFNRPHLHRGHHSNLPRLRGKNLGGVLIVWDRLFGTFEADCKEVRTFGIGQAPTLLSPLAANWAPVRAMWAAARAR